MLDFGDRVDRLSEAQRESLRLVYRHHNSKQQAKLLGISPHTVDERIKRALRVLDVSSRFEAARILAEFEAPQPSAAQPPDPQSSAPQPLAPQPLRVASDRKTPMLGTTTAADHERDIIEQLLGRGAGASTPDLDRAADRTVGGGGDARRSVHGGEPDRGDPIASTLSPAGGGEARDRHHPSGGDLSRVPQRRAFDHDLDPAATSVAILATAAAIAILLAVMLWGASMMLDHADTLARTAR